VYVELCRLNSVVSMSSLVDLWTCYQSSLRVEETLYDKPGLRVYAGALAGRPVVVKEYIDQRHAIQVLSSCCFTWFHI
jgi:hypothetical protein